MLKVLGKISLRLRILLNVIALLVITIMGALVMVGYTYRMEGLMTRIIDKYVVGLQAAQSMEISLVNQKGFASYYLLDSNPYWLTQMEKYRHIFENKLEETRLLATSPPKIRLSIIIIPVIAKGA